MKTALASVVLCIITAPALAQDEPVAMDYPLGLAVGEDGTIYIADQNVPAIFRATPEGAFSVYYRGSVQFRTPLNRVRALGFDTDGTLLALDSATREVYRMVEGEEGVEPVPLTDGYIGIPMAVVVPEDGRPVVADLETHRLYRIVEEGEPEEVAQVSGPRGLALDRDGTFVVVSHGGPNQLVRVTAEGEVTPIVEGRPFEFPHAVVLDAEGNYLVSDGYAQAIWRVTRAGEVRALVQGDLLQNPQAMAWEADGNLLVVDPHAQAVFRVTPAGEVSVAVANP